MTALRGADAARAMQAAMAEVRHVLATPIDTPGDWEALQSSRARVARVRRAYYVVAAALALALLACSPRTPGQAEAAYTAELLRCVDTSPTLAESRACRAAVDARWGVDGGRR